MRYLTFALLVAACTDERSCPDLDPPQGARVQCHMLRYLDAEALGDDAIVDVADTSAAAIAAHPGWTRVADTAFVLGAPAIYTTGQRISFDADGAIRLATFAAPEHAAFLQTIEVAADGSVSNPGAVRLPR